VTAITVGSASAITLLIWNQDLLLASLYHIVWATETTDGSKYCSAWANTLAADGTASVISATKGLTGATKCTWFLKTVDGDMGPTVQLTAAAYSNFYLHWVEFLTTAALGTDGQMPVADGASYQVGAYAVTGGEVWMNPVTATIAGADATWGNSATVWNMVVRDPTNYWPGTLGALTFYTGQAGPFKQSQVGAIDQALLQSMYKSRNDLNSAYSTALTTFNTDRDNFNSANKDENTRKADFFKALFEPAIVVPSRPCPPNRPAAWGMMLTLDLAAARATAYTWPATFTVSTVDNYGAQLKYSTTNKPVALFHNANGYLQATTDTTTVNLVDTYKAFGRLGQGTMNTAASPFNWVTPLTADRPGMLISVFPNADADAGLDTAAKKITFDGKAKAW
jgi:hypothetical protein